MIIAARTRQQHPYDSQNTWINKEDMSESAVRGSSPGLRRWQLLRMVMKVLSTMKPSVGMQHGGVEDSNEGYQLVKSISSPSLAPRRPPSFQGCPSPLTSSVYSLVKTSTAQEIYSC
jgi:hypothetical protein